MLAIIPSLLLALSLASFTQARDYVQFSSTVASSYNYPGTFGTLSFLQGSSAACGNAYNSRSGCVAWNYNAGIQRCYTCTKYPKICSGWLENSGLTQGYVDRCHGTPGYVLGRDSTCIHTGGVAYSDAAHAQACSTVGTGGNAGVAAPLPSPAYKKKRSDIVVEQSPFVGGKVCPIGEMGCPLGNGFGCINVKEDLNSCGGCLGGAGADCSDIIGADEVACELGSCVVRSCTRGHALSPSGQCLKQ